MLTLRARLRPLLAAAVFLATATFGSHVTLATPAEESSSFAFILDRAERALDAGNLDIAHTQVMRALERDQKSLAAWDLRARIAEAAGQTDEHLFSAHRHYNLAEVQGWKKSKLKELRVKLEGEDPLAADLFSLKELFLDKLEPLAADYEKDGRPHSAIRIHKEIIALDPQNKTSADAIERIAASPDPSLAGDAKPKDLLADVSAEWVAEFDADHDTWKERAKEDRQNYVTYTDAGYEVMVRAAEAMEQMNAFYRIFFRYGTEEDGGSVPKISLHIFKDRDEYLEKGIGPPVEWSAGHFTGNAVETYIGGGGFEGMTGTLFHEAAHQFVSLATSASGWLNEGLASFFEGTRILANGTVIMNLPANHRLFPLADRMERGWMTSAADGIDDADPNATPEKAPTFRIIVENRYQWGPPWYAPTWGLVYFLYNYQDRVDGRFVYRDAFGEFMNSSGGRMGDGAVENFEETVLAHPSKPTPDAEFDEALILPTKIKDLDELWKDWILELREIQSGRKEIDRPYLAWAENALVRGEIEVAAEHFEKGLLSTPSDLDLLRAFADFLAERRADEDRAAALMLDAIRIVEATPDVDEKLLKKLERQLGKWDARQKKLNSIHEKIEASALSVAERYLAAERPMMAMDVAWRLGDALDMPELFDVYARALEVAGHSPWIWSLAYNESDLDGWVTAGKSAFKADGSFLTANFSSANQFDYQFLSLDTVTSGDFSLEAKVQVDKGKVGFAGLVFGKKSDQTFHALVLYPPHDTEAEGLDKPIEQPPSVDLTSFYGAGNFRIWRHTPVMRKVKRGESATSEWHDLRIDVVGSSVDIWVDGEFTASQEFGDPNVVRGSFGLITAPGESRFRDVRYLARPARDPGAAVERRLRFEALEAAGGDTGSVSGSYLGKVPPMPTVRRWIGDEFPGFTGGDAPKVRLILLWSIQQNDLMPVDGWVRELDAKYADDGLEMLSILSAIDDDAADAYLAANAWAGYQCVDEIGEGGIGLTFDDYDIARFNLPRLLLVDIDGKVVWEGDPGFRIGTGYEPGMASYLDSPLKELIEKRDLKALVAWHERWTDAQKKARDGDFTSVIDVLDEADGFDAKVDRNVARAQAMKAAVKRAAESPVELGETFADRGSAASLTVLIAWGEALGITYDKRTDKAIKKLLREDSVRNWDKAATECRRAVLHMGTEREEAKLDELEASLEGLVSTEGDLIDELLASVKKARARGDDIPALLEDVPLRPARWLSQRYFAW